MTFHRDLGLGLSLVLLLSACAAGGGGQVQDDNPVRTADGGGVKPPGDSERDGGTRPDDPDLSDGGNDDRMCQTACAPFDCGSVPDGCGGFLSCSSCAPGEVCGLSQPNKCGLVASDCTPKTALEVCAGKCGAVSDGCSDVIVCDAANGGVACGVEQVCGGYAGNQQPSVCVDKPSCTPTTCAALGVSCGLVGDGCSGVLDCTALTGGCGDERVCGSGANTGTCVEPPTCTRRTAAVACASTCGLASDGCGGTIDCESNPSTACPAGTSCGAGGVPGQCGSGQVCQPAPVEQVCAGKCGFMPDGCHGGYSCNSTNGGQTCDANAGESCGGGGTPNTCGKPVCVAKSQAEACASVGGSSSCGLVSDGCGALVDCGGCLQDQACGLSVPNVCAEIPVCQPTAVAVACAGKCGTVPNGCGGSYNCDGSNGGVTCTGMAFCGALAPNQCGTPMTTCTPRTCEELGSSCGLASDGCGSVINCWSGCAENDPSCTQACPDAAQACLADPQTGAQSCVTGTGGCIGPLCGALPTCDPGQATRLTGTVRTPGRQQGSNWVNRIAVPNAVVYIPADPTATLPGIFEGVQAGNPASCGRCEDEALVVDGQTILASAVTNYRGEFTLEGRIPVGQPFELVIKVGKWRRVIEVPAGVAQSCSTAALDFEYTRLPRHRTDGRSGTHLPKVAISTGEVDEMECVFRNIGIAESEFTVPADPGRIHMYRANGARMGYGQCSGTFYANLFDWNRPCSNNNNAGCVNGNSGCSWARNSPPDSELYSNQNTLNSYDMVVWDCEGSEQQHDTHDPKIVAYVNAGGRMFASHYSYTWIEGNGSLNASATWNTEGIADTGTGFVSLPSGPTARTRANPVKSLMFRDWLDWHGALTGTAAGQLNNPGTPQFAITDPRDRAGANVGVATDEWVYRNSSGAKVQQLSFNTPYGAPENQICGRVAYSGFHVAATNNGGDSAYFPGVCSNGELTAQEKVLVFMLFDLAACVSEGDPPTPPACTPKTPAELCPNVNDACGYLADGCGGVVNCGGCSGGFYCDGSTCRPQQCTPATCSSLGFNCGAHADGCGGIALNAQGAQGCGTCTENQLCGVGGPGVCGTVSCLPSPLDTACPPGSCGLVSDGCGGTHQCGTCPDGQVCGGGGPNVCGPGSCPPIPIDTACAGFDCGLVSDGCGGTHDCGECTLPDTCGGGGMPNVCGHPVCTPFTKADACVGLECGWVSDGCGGAIHCGDCPDGRICGGAGPNLCGAACEPTTCDTQGAECGAIADLCGGILDCGPCPPGQTCGAGGPNKCGDGPSCTPASCTSAGAECGLIGDGCGDVVDCGPCTVPGETCGGAGEANQCGTGTGGCDELTCLGQGVQCGAASDGCGGVLDCGGCPPGYTCERGECLPIPVVE